MEIFHLMFEAAQGGFFCGKHHRNVQVVISFINRGLRQDDSHERNEEKMHKSASNFQR